MENKIVYNTWIANELLRKGYTIVGVNRNPKMQERSVFFFKDEKEIEKDLKILIEQTMTNKIEQMRKGV